MMSIDEMNKYQLIEAMIHDLGDQNDGVQVREYRNEKILTGCVEGLYRLREMLHKEDEAGQKTDK